MRSPRLACLTVALAACSGGGPTKVARPEPTPLDAAPPPSIGEDFEAANAGALPGGWRLDDLSRATTFTVAAIDDRAGQVLEARVEGEGGGALRRTIDVERFRGQRIVVEADARYLANLWWSRGTIGFEVARPGITDYDDRAASARIKVRGWASYRAVIDVADDASGLDLVVRAVGEGQLHVDDLRVTALGPAGTGDEPPRRLDGRGLDNVVAFARLYGAVRYFHPSDEAAALTPEDWERFVVRGVRAVEPARDAAALASAMNELFAPIGPTVQIWDASAARPAAPASAGGRQVRWMHRGVGISGGVYSSERGDPMTVPRYVSLTTQLDAAALRGKTATVTMRVRARLVEPSDVGIWMSVTRAGQQQGFYTEPERQPALADGWQTVEITAPIDDDATRIDVGVQVIGDADAWVEPLAVTVDGAEVALPAWGARELSTAWERGGARDDLYDVKVGASGCAKRASCAKITATPTPTPTPDDRPWEVALPGGVAARMPVALDADDTGTLPAAAVAAPLADPSPLVASDRATRLAAVIIGWNVPQHFYPYFDVVPDDWAAELPAALGRAAEDAGTRALHATLRTMIAGLHDGHGYVNHAAEPLTHVVPWTWEWVTGELVVTDVAADCACEVARGDVVSSIDGVATADLRASALAFESTATPQHAAWNLLRRWRAGPPGAVSFGIRRGTDAERVVEVERRPLDAAMAELAEPRPAQGAELAPGIRYVDIDSLTLETWTALLPDLAAADVVLIDLRGYPGAMPLAGPLGHLTDRTLQSPVFQVPTPARPDQEGMTFVESRWTIAPATPRLARAVFLTDGRAVSAAETWMQIVAGYQLGEIVGATTAGTNGDINPFAVPGGFQITWTGLKVLNHDRSTFHGVGVPPTVPAERTVAGVAAGEDEVLAVALEVARRPVKKTKKKSPPARR